MKGCAMSEFIEWMFPNLTFDGFTIGCLIWSGFLFLVAFYLFFIEDRIK